jgi:hypothetical protein
MEKDKRKERVSGLLEIIKTVPGAIVEGGLLTATGAGVLSAISGGVCYALKKPDLGFDLLAGGALASILGFLSLMFIGNGIGVDSYVGEDYIEKFIDSTKAYQDLKKSK